MSATLEQSIETASTGFVLRIPVNPALSVEWKKVRRVRQMLAEKFHMQWNPNAPIPKTEKWIYIVAWEDGEVDLEGAPRVALRTFECEVEVAAQAIAKNTHRLATEHEIQKFVRERREREVLCQQESERVNPQLGAQRYSLEATKALTRAAEAMSGSSPQTRGGRQKGAAEE